MHCLSDSERRCRRVPAPRDPPGVSLAVGPKDRTGGGPCGLHRHSVLRPERPEAPEAQPLEVDERRGSDIPAALSASRRPARDQHTNIGI